MDTQNQSQRVLELEEENRLLKLELDKSQLSEKRFLDALRLSPTALCHHDLELKCTWLYNGHMKFSTDEVIGKTDWDILPKELADRMGKVKRRVLKTGVGERIEMPTVFGDEDSEYFDLIVEPLKEDDTGQVIGLSCSGIDVADDRRRREAYKSSEENLRFIFNSSPTAIVVTHIMDGRPLFYNMAAENLFQLSEWTVHEGKNNSVLCWLKVRKDVDACFAKGDEVCDHKFDFTNDAGEHLYMSLSATKIPYDGEIAILSTFHDLSQEAHYQKRLKNAKEKAELANIAKSQFLASASHDLRQPLHAMGLLLSVLEQYVLDPKGQKVLSRVMTSLEAMNGLFEGILDISKLDANAVDVIFEPVQVSELFKTLMVDFMPAAQEKGLDIRFVNSSAYIESDGVQVERILRNLIMNALRYTDEGRVLVGCRRTHDQLSFCIYDTGVGIAPEDQAKVFQEFRQVGKPERDRRKGLGLGLAICERISDLLDTKIHFSSEEGKGSVFWFTVPLLDRTKLEDKHEN